MSRSRWRSKSAATGGTSSPRRVCPHKKVCPHKLGLACRHECAIIRAAAAPGRGGAYSARNRASHWRRLPGMSDERTFEQQAAAAADTGAGKPAPQVPAVKGSDGRNGRPRVPAGTVLEQGGDVPVAGETASPIDYGDALRALHEGDVVRGVIVHIDREGVLVDVGTKSEGIIPPNELSRESGRRPEHIVAVGDEIDVYVLNTDDDEAGQLILSKKRADFEKAWDRVIEAQRNGEKLHAMV